MVESNICEILESIVQDCESIANDAIQNVSKRVQGDIYRQAKTFAQRYYDNYNPKVYKQRTGSLKRSFKKYGSNIGDLSVEVGVEYDSSLLKNKHFSNSRKHQSGDVWKSVAGLSFEEAGSNNGIPESGWIFEQFFDGIHPWAQQDGENQQTLMEEFLDTEAETAVEYMAEEVLNAILSRL